MKKKAVKMVAVLLGISLTAGTLSGRSDNGKDCT